MAARKPGLFGGLLRQRADSPSAAGGEDRPAHAAPPAAMPTQPAASPVAAQPAPGSGAGATGGLAPEVGAQRGACRGLPLSDGEHVLKADTARGIASACARILHDPALGRRLALAGQALLRENFLVALPFKPVPLHVRDALP